MEELGISDLLLIICTVLIILKMLNVSGFNNREHLDADEPVMKVVTPITEEDSPATESLLTSLFSSLKPLLSKTADPYRDSLPHKAQLALDSIKKRDSQFTTQKFIELTMKLHVKVIKASNGKDLASLANSCSEEVRRKLAQEIASKQKLGIELRSVCTYEAITIISAYADAERDYIAMHVNTQQIYYGTATPQKKVAVHDKWIISRGIAPKRGEEWQLHEISSEEAPI